MKKILLLATTLLLSVFSFAYEYVNDKYCIYRIDVGKQTAEVVNFCSEATAITIPASFNYQGDEYIVEGIGMVDFERCYDLKYCYYDYESIRSKIVELNLPRSLKQIELFAFKDMTRLKKLSIPSTVKIFSHDIFSGNERLEYITLEGLPCCEYSMLTEWKTHKFCLNEVLDPVASLDSMVMCLREVPCPKLKTIEVLPLKEYLKYSEILQDTLAKYKSKLKEHPYYVDGDYFSDVRLPLSIGSNNKKNLDKQVVLCQRLYKQYTNEMEQICKQESPEIYADRYCANNPGFSKQIDVLLNDYKCEYTKQSLALAVLNNNQLGEKCQESLWRENSYLYKDKEAFLVEYRMAPDINEEIAMRKNISKNLKNVIRDYKIATKGIYDLALEDKLAHIRRFCGYYDEMKKYGIPVSILIIEKDPKAVKEFEKNGQYFANPDEFFAAYIRSNYNNILKEKKKAHK